MARKYGFAALAIAFIGGIVTALLISTAAATQQQGGQGGRSGLQAPSLVWSLDNGDLRISNPTALTFLIVGYSEDGVAQLPWVFTDGELLLPTERLTKVVAYPVEIGDGVEFADVPQNPEAAISGSALKEPCMPTGDCPPPPGCEVCPPPILGEVAPTIRFQGMLLPERVGR